MRIEGRGRLYLPQIDDDHVARRNGDIDGLLGELLPDQRRSFFGSYHIGSTIERHKLIAILLDQLVWRERRQLIPLQNMKRLVYHANARNDMELDATSARIDAVAFTQLDQVVKR